MIGIRPTLLLAAVPGVFAAVARPERSGEPFAGRDLAI
jgi:hypothetical protein